MKFYPKSRKAMLLRKCVGEATNPETNEKTDLSVSMSTLCPIITMPNGDAVIIEWEDLIEIAQNHADAQNSLLSPKAESTE